VEHVDVFHLHAVQAAHYHYALTELVPALLHQKELGKIGHLGITETPPRDPDQAMLSRALNDSCWEVIMLAFHMMNQRPRVTVFPHTLAQGIGTLLMFVVRNIFSRPDVLRETVLQLAHNGEIPQSVAYDSEPLGFLVHDGGASSVTDAAYRFARHEPGADVILFGTGEREHLRANVASLLKPPLPPADVETLQKLFGQLRGIGLVFPDHSRSGMSLKSV
jgi:L-galactose dehydrogenase